MAELVLLLALTSGERELILDVLNEKREAKPGRRDLAALREKFASAVTSDIFVGVYGGQVQWIAGSPVPMRVCDYDGDEEDLPDRDDDGVLCRISSHPASAETP